MTVFALESISELELGYRSRRITEKEAEILPVTQVLSPGNLGEKPMMPSALYIPYEGELERGLDRLPWSDSNGS